MIYGIGIDVVDVSEFEQVLSDPKTFFITNYFTAQERDYCYSKAAKEQARHFAVRYAAKEAFLKALDGPRLEAAAAFLFSYIELEILNDSSGRPFFCYHGKLLLYLREIGLGKAHLSMSHSDSYCVANVLLETKN